MVKAFLDCLIRYKEPGGGILGDASGFYGCVEEQGRGALHLHMLIWMTGYTSPSKMKERMRVEEDFKDRVLSYLQDVIKQHSPLAEEIVVNMAQEKDCDEDEEEEEEDNSDESEHQSDRKLNEKSPTENTNDIEGNNEDLKEMKGKKLSAQEKEFVLTRIPDDINDPSFDMKSHLDKLVKSCNIHQHNSSCYKYGDEDICRYGYPKDIVTESELSDEEIKIKRLERWVNNYNETVLVCTLSNNDIKFVGSGKDSNATAHYMCDYQCKSDLTAHNILPLVKAAVKNTEIGAKNKEFEDEVQRSRAMVFKSVNKVISEREMSGTHVASLLLGYEDKYSSHHFRVLNILSFLSLFKSDAADDDSLDELYRIQHGNNGVILFHEANDYLHRGDELTDMNLYDYTSNIEKITVRSEQYLKDDEGNTDVKLGRPRNQRIYFDTQHPQSETHIQRRRSATLTPRLTWMPPDIKSNPEKFHMCMLLLFKPFMKLSDLKEEYDTWQEAFSNYQFSPYHENLISNFIEMHEGIARKKQLDKERREIDIESGNEVISPDCEYYCLSDDEDEDFLLEELSSNENSNWSTKTLHEKTREGIQIICNTKELMYNTNPCQQKKNNPIQKPSRKQIDNWKKTIEMHKKDALKRILNIPEEQELPCMSTDFSKSSVGEPTIECKSTPSMWRIVKKLEKKYNLNTKQCKAYRLIADNVVRRLHGTSVNQILGYVGGPGGTGKTRVIHALVELHEQLKIRSALRLCAYTGTAAGGINGVTISSLAQISRDQGKRTDLKKLEENWNGVNTIIIDEVSMVSPAILSVLHKNLVRAKHTLPTVPFGGVDIIFCGDFNQFAPIRASALYYGADSETETKPVVRQSDIDREFGCSLWNQLTDVIILTEQNRVKDKSYAQLLTRISKGECSQADYDLLKTRLISNVNMHEQKFKEAPFIVPGNELRREINKIHANWNSNMIGQKLRISVADDYCSKIHLTPSKQKQLDNLTYTQAGSLPKELELFAGLPVMLTKNTAVEMGLTNGSMGTVTRIHFEKDQHIPKYVVVKFPDTTCPKLPNLENKEIPIFPIHSSFQYKFPGTTKSTTIRRTQLPLVSAYSYTSYKSQGKTLDAVVVDLQPASNRPLDPSFSYVPLSRVRSLQDLVILREFPISVLQSPRPIQSRYDVHMR